PARPEPPVPVLNPASPDTTNPDPEGQRPDSGLSPEAPPPLPEGPVPAGSPLPLPEGPALVGEMSPDNRWSEASWSPSRTATATEGATSSTSCDSPTVLVPPPVSVSSTPPV
ncbi:unnamed protein product, partial [Ixodes persulcatus]